MADPSPTFWQWRVRLKPETPRDPWFSHKTWKMLRRRMTEADAANWAEKNGCDIEKVEGSGETRSDLYGPHGYGGLVTPAPGMKE
jgi:hypothetical protein